jgi:hypothetical protein
VLAIIQKVVRYYGFPYSQEHKYYGFLTFFFILECSITFRSYFLWVQEDGRRARIVFTVEEQCGCSRD